MPLRDNLRGVARERRAQPFARDQHVSTDVRPLCGKSADFTVVISVIEETAVVHRRLDEREMKEREAFGPERSRPRMLRQKRATQPVAKG